MVAAGDRAPAATMAVAARESGENYAPFRADAATAPVAVREDAGPVERPELTPEQLWKKTATLLERLNKALSDDVLDALEDQPEKLRHRISEALEAINGKLESRL